MAGLLLSDAAMVTEEQQPVPGDDDDDVMIKPFDAELPPSQTKG